ncbi:MAG TPA: hypothetical protein PLO50_08950, partial [Nitrospira sp.]|nr:hypothetical protein [Nitrospira sp.]
GVPWSIGVRKGAGMPPEMTEMEWACLAKGGVDREFHLTKHLDYLGTMAQGVPIQGEGRGQALSRGKDNGLERSLSGGRELYSGGVVALHACRTTPKGSGRSIAMCR